MVKFSQLAHDIVFCYYNIDEDPVIHLLSSGWNQLRRVIEDGAKVSR